MKHEQEHIPVVEAVPCSPHSGGNLPGYGIYFVDLRIGLVNFGFSVQGNPPQFSEIDPSSPVYKQTLVGHYIHGISLPQIDILNLSDPAHLMKLLHANTGNPRRLWISSSPYFIAESLGSCATTKGPLYKHELPTNSDLGIKLVGFPPVIQNVTPLSPMNGRLYPGQTIVALLVPGQLVMDIEAGGFTAARVREQLHRTCEKVGRQLVVIDGSLGKKEKGSSRALDDCIIS